MKTKEPREKETPVRCVCKMQPIMVKAKGKYMYACPDGMNCSQENIGQKGVLAEDGKRKTAD